MPVLTPLIQETARPTRPHQPRLMTAAPEAASPLPALLLAAGLAAYANFNVIWNHFYRGIPQLFDTGWYAHLVHRSAPLLSNPPTVAFETINREFYSTHYSPLLWLLALPSHVVPVSPEVWLGCLEALKYAAIAFFTWHCVRTARIHRIALAPAAAAPPGGRILANMLVVLAPFTGVLLACSAYPHFETWFVPLSLGFLWMLLQGRLLPAAPFFVAALMVREEVGFHLCGVLLVASGFAWWTRRRLDREVLHWLGFAAAGFAWSATAVLLMKAWFPGDDAFTRVYLGDPPFAHLTSTWIKHIAAVHLEQRGYLWMPLLVYMVWAATHRAWWVLIGYAAFVPWFLFNFFAATINPATLSLYYAYPFAVALLWPVAGRIVFDRTANPTRTLAWITTAFAVSIFGYIRGDDNHWRSLAGDMAFPELGTSAAREAVVSRLGAARDRGERLSVDDALAGLAPAEFDTRNLFGQSPPGVTLAGFFTNGRSRKIAWETTRSLPYHYEVSGTPVVIVSQEPLDWPGLGLISAEPGSLLPFLANPARRLSWASSSSASAGATHIVCEGPDHWYLWSGETWSTTVTLALDPLPPFAGRDRHVSVEVLAHGSASTTVVARTEVPVPVGEAGERIQISRTLEFLVPGREGSDIAVRVRAPSQSSGLVKDVVLWPIKTRPRDSAGQPLR